MVFNMINPYISLDRIFMDHSSQNLPMTFQNMIFYGENTLYVKLNLLSAHGWLQSHKFVE